MIRFMLTPRADCQMHKQSGDRGWQPIHVPGIKLKLDF